MTEEKTEEKVVSEEDSALSTFTQNFDEYMNDFDDNVFAGSEIRISRAAIMQLLSPEIKARTPDYYPGQIVDNVSRDILTRELKSPWLVGKVPEDELIKCNCSLIVPAFKLPSEFIKWKDLKREGRGWHFKTLDRNESRVKEGLWPNAGGTWGTKEGQDGPPPVTENCNYMCLFIDPVEKKLLSDGIITTFCKTSFKAGRNLTTYIRKGFRKSIPAFGMTYWLYTLKFKDDDTGNEYYYFNVHPAMRTVEINTEALKLGLRWHNQFSEKENGRGKALQNAYLSSAAMQEESDESFTENTTDDNPIETEDDMF